MDAAYSWKLTLNHYRSMGEERRCGFPWHRDLIANGAASCILGLGASGRLQFGEEPPARGGGGVDGLLYDMDDAHDADRRSSDHAAEADAEIEPLATVMLEPGDLLVLVGDARWKYLHRVLPEEPGTSVGERVSIVWGIW